MKHLVEFSLEDGGSVIVEVEELEQEGTMRAGRAAAIEKAKETLESALNKILPATKSIVGKLRSSEIGPDEIELSFGVKLSTVAGMVIASASGEANFDITVRWTNEKETARKEFTRP